MDDDSESESFDDSSSESAESLTLEDECLRACGTSYPSSGGSVPGQGDTRLETWPSEDVSTFENRQPIIGCFYTKVFEFYRGHLHLGG